MSWRNNPKTKDQKLTKILSLLQERKRLTFTEIQKELGVSNPTMCDYIEELKDKIEPFLYNEHGKKPHPYYRIRPKYNRKVEAILGQSKALEFIKSFSEPLYSYKESQSKKASISALTQEPNLKEIEKPQETLDSITLSVLPALEELSEMPGLRELLQQSGKVALIITLGRDLNS